MKERWKFLGRDVPLGYDDSVDGKDCYWFRGTNIGGGSITAIIPVEKFWP
jgi:hypothetical protein